MARRHRIDPELEQSHVRRAARWIGGGWDVLTWAHLGLVVLVAVSRLIGGAAPALLQPFQASLPILFAPLWLTALVSAATRRWVQLIAAILLALVHVSSVLPAREKPTQPFWATGAPTMKVLAVNIASWNREPEKAFDEILRPTSDGSLAHGADAIVIVELTPELAKRFEARPELEEFPHRSVLARAENEGGAIYSRHPFDETERFGRRKLPLVRIVLPSGERVRLIAAHPFAPVDTEKVRWWSDELRTMRRLIDDTERTGPLIIAGDFNATRWQPPFGRLLAGPVRDAHETVGKGLSFSWPTNLMIPAFFRLDRAVVDDEVWPLAVTDLEIPGSDHRGFVATFAIRALRPPGPSSSASDSTSDSVDTTVG